jgi:transcriptional regulator with XRE-family HTH domain
MARPLDDRRYLQQLGFKVREARIARKLTQADLADRCGLHRTFVGSVERGERNLSVLNLRRFARHLRVRAADLLPAQDL